MKKETKVVAIALVLLLFFTCGFGLGATKSGIKITIEGATGGAATQQVVATTEATTAPTTQATTQATTQPTASEPAASEPAASEPAASEPAASEPAASEPASSGSSVPSTPAEVAAAYNKAINDYRAFTGNVTVKKVETIAIEAKDLPAAVASVVNGVVEKFTGTTENTFTFTNGVDPDGRKPADKMIPGGRDAAVDPAGLVTATATANPDGGYTMNLKFVAESSVFDGTSNTSVPTYHMGAMDPLDLGTLSIDPIKISSANMSYPGATTEATVDAQGRLIKLHNNLPLEGSGSGGVGPIKATINIGGSMDSTWEMTYA